MKTEIAGRVHNGIKQLDLFIRGHLVSWKKPSAPGAYGSAGVRITQYAPGVGFGLEASETPKGLPGRRVFIHLEPEAAQAVADFIGDSRLASQVKEAAAFAVREHPYTGTMHPSEVSAGRCTAFAAWLAGALDVRRPELAKYLKSLLMTGVRNDASDIGA